jgi:hypothetical protein
MDKRIKTFLIADGEPKRDVGKQYEKQTGDTIYIDGVGYKIRVASKFEHRRQREQELHCKRV